MRIDVHKKIYALEKFSKAHELVQLFEKSDGEFLICGGGVRDMVLKRTPHDIDFATSLSYPEVLHVLEKKYSKQLRSGSMSLVTTGKQFGVVRISFKKLGQEYEIAQFRSDEGIGDGRRPHAVNFVADIERDAQRRDFTMNALYINPKTGLVLDFVGGLADIKSRRIRFVGRPHERLQEDWLRAFRLARFVSTYQMSVDTETVQRVKKTTRRADFKSSITYERIQEEFRKAVSFPGASGKDYMSYIEALDMLGLLEIVLPELVQLKKCTQGPLYHMEGNAYVHSLLAVSHLRADSSFELIFATLLHDIGKSAARQKISFNHSSMPGMGLERVKWKVSFKGHEHIGAELVGQIGRRWKLSKRHSEQLVWLLKHHLKGPMISGMTWEKALVYSTHEWSDDLLELGRCDRLASHEVSTALHRVNLQDIRLSARRMRDVQNVYKQLKPLWAGIEKKVLSGDNIMRQYSRKKGGTIDPRQIGKIKNLCSQFIRKHKVIDTKVAEKFLWSLL